MTAKPTSAVAALYERRKLLHGDGDLERFRGPLQRIDRPAENRPSLKRSAERSKRRKGTPYQSAMFMLNFYINRAGKNLPQKRKRIFLERAKDEVRDAFGRN